MRSIIAFILGVVLLLSIFQTFTAAPKDFPVPYDLNIKTGETLRDISAQLAEDHVVRSARTFEILMVMFGSDKAISEGEYYFQKPLSSLVIAMRISGKQFGILPKKVTFPEGYTNVQMSQQLAKAFPNLNTAEFLHLSENTQGYLFPDTYAFFPSVTPDFIVATMKANYQRKLAVLRGDIMASGHTESQIIIMASILEKEAKGNADGPTIAGILWKRIDAGIPLQVDAAPGTYLAKGLPEAPIDNPGLVAINAAIHPVASPYLYYLHDAKGAIHYASTYQQHQQNISKYLK